ncbi:MULTISPECIES: dsRBD fold-containing protein [unclassified Streptomyces]|uniref:dsRBD fold-containing protein n=1 Tax=unclassified Streptomyces TaxID=2593676 RepID=UPI0037F39622
MLTTRYSSNVTGTGVARRTSADSVPEIGDELAAGQALEDLALRLQATAVDDERAGSPGWKSHRGTPDGD